MTFRKETPWIPSPDLCSDYFEEDASYTNWRPRGGGDYLMIYTEAGAGRFVTAKGTVIAKKGEAVLYSPHELQDYSTDGKRGFWNLSWVHFLPKPHWQIWLDWPVSEEGLKIIALGGGEVGQRFKQALHDVIRLSRHPIPEAMDLASNSLEAALLWARSAASREGWHQIDARVRKAMGYLTEHLREPFSMEELAGHCHVSGSRLAHLFKEQTKTTPQQFFEAQRMRQARNLLRFTGRSVAEVAADVGYDDPYYFTKRFHRHAGESPSAFRKNVKRS